MAYREERKYVVGGGPNQFVTSAPAKFTSSQDVLRQKLKLMIPQHQIFQCLTTNPVLMGFQHLIENKILSVPLYSTDKQKYVGFLDIIDIVHYFLQTLNDCDVNQGYDIFKAKFDKVTCGQVSDMSRRNPYRAIDNEATVSAAIHLVCHSKIHRIPILDGDGSLEHVLSQSHIVKYLSKHVQLFPFVKKTVAELSLGYKDKIFTVSKDSTVKAAFELMRDNNVSGVGVVDEKEELVGLLSVSDIRHVGYNSDLFAKCLLKVTDFLKLTGQKLITVTPESTVGKIAQIFATNPVHRIFVLKDKKPIGVISLLDFLQLFDE